MAMKRPGKGYNKTGGNVGRAMTGAATGVIPGVSHVKAYKVTRMAGGGVGTGIAAGAASTFVPFAGAASGAYRGYHKNQRNAKTGVRSARSTPTRTKGRVQKKGY